MGYTILIAKVAHGINLIFHKRNKRRNYYGGTIHQQRGQLIAQRLASTRGHEHKSVMFPNETHHDLLLLTFKCVKAKIFLQCSDKPLFISHSLKV